MSILQSTIIHLENAHALLSVDLNGGAITDFHLKQIPINPLTFRLKKEQMPANSRKGAPFQGHFICAPRWGAPSEDEAKKGLPYHGELSNMMWTETPSKGNIISMEALSKAEELHIQRNIEIIENTFAVTETVRNISARTRTVNIVQHPTIAAPFLDSDTRLFCNASDGYHNQYSGNPSKMQTLWPKAMYPDYTFTDISHSHSGKTAVHSYIVKPSDRYGWLVAYSPKYQLLFGYIWERFTYPWINLWCDYHNGKIRYRGLEFGVTGIHQPADIILQNISTIFGQPIFEVVNAGCTLKKRYHCFLEQHPGTFTNILSVDFNEKHFPVVNFVL